MDLDSIKLTKEEENTLLALGLDKRDACLDPEFQDWWPEVGPEGEKILEACLGLGALDLVIITGEERMDPFEGPSFKVLLTPLGLEVFEVLDKDPLTTRFSKKP